MKELFTRYPNPIFAATVLGNGDILQAALEAGFATVVGATTSAMDAALCRDRFKGNIQVQISDGEEIILFDVIQEFNLCITFCLSATSNPPPALIHELSTIRHHRIKTHTFLIQDTHLLGTEAAAGLTLYQVKMTLREVNEMYRFVEFPELNLMAATVP